MYKRQQGLTLIGLVIILALLIFGGFIAMKLFPIYQEAFSVKAALNGLQQEPGIEKKSPAEIKQQLWNRFYVSYVESVQKQDVTISKRDGYVISIVYEVRKPLIGNLDVVAKFDFSVDLLE
ncbi:MAG: DUF4845 domain-containing protein [Xanthomonadales bacterium]|nr:DUF4845 domain-containing protein [Xanthomonadales bacterium]